MGAGLPTLVLDWLQDHRTLLLFLGAAAAGFAIGRIRTHRDTTYQNLGEAAVASALKAHFSLPGYHLMNHLTLPWVDGTTQIDHVLVSRFGVFVIETKHYRGWLFADARDAKWTQVLFGYTFRFQNPLIQNNRHTQAIRACLDFLPPDAVKAVVVFSGSAEFKTPMPQGVFHISGLIDYLRKQTTAVMSLNRMQFCVGRLETIRLAISETTDVEHIESLERRYGNAR